MISTSNYKNCNTKFYRKIDINSDKNNIEYFSKLFPTFSYLDNVIEFKNDEEKYIYYTKLYYDNVLSALDPEEIYNELDYSILLSCEDVDDFSHRHLVAAWFDLFLEKRVNEVMINGSHIYNIERNEDYKSLLENIIKSEIDMKNFNSLRALYLFNKGEKFEQLANQYNRNCSHKLIRRAYDLKQVASETEKIYNKKRR